MSRLGEYADSRELAVNLTLRELRSRYKRSILGWTWSLLNPLSTLVIFSVVFSFFLKIEPPVGDPSELHSFGLFLLSGLLPWMFISNGMMQGSTSLLSNSNLIKKVYFPREIIIFSTVASLLVTFLIELSVLLIALLIAGNMVLPWIPMLLVLILIETLMVLGIGLLVSTLNVYFRDVQHLLSILTQALFYSMPIVYPLSLVPEHAHIFGMRVAFREIYLLNPLVRMVEAFRDLIYDLRFPPLVDLAYLLAWAVGLFVIGTVVFRRFERRLAEEL